VLNPQYLLEHAVKLYNGVKEISYKELSKMLFKELDRQLAEAQQYR
jgi:hypothetical protein